MADTKISALTAATTPLAGTELVPIVQGGVTKAVAVSSISSGGGGTVTSVAVSGGTTGLTTSGGPVTGSGTITLAGTLAVANGGTGATTQQASINALAGATTSGQYLRGNGSNVSMSAIQAGDLPAIPLSGLSQSSATTGQVPTWNGSAWAPATPSGGGSGSPGGSTTQVQFNDAGAFAGDAGLAFDKATGKLTVGGPAQASGFRMAAAGIVTDATAARTLTDADNGKVIYFTSASAITVTTSSGLGAGFCCTLVQGGAGRITVAAGSGTSVVSYGSFSKTAGQYAAISAMCPVSDTFYLNGDLG